LEGIYFTYFDDTYLIFQNLVVNLHSEI
jgi:hypothetical protein